MSKKDKVRVPLFHGTPESTDVSELVQGLRNMRRVFFGGRRPKYDDRQLAAVYELLRRCLGWSAEKSRGWITDNVKASESTIKRAARRYEMLSGYSPADLARIADDLIKQGSFTPDDLKKLRSQCDSLGSEENNTDPS